MNTARINTLELDADGVFLVSATTSCCRKRVLHGAGRDPENLVLGHRTSHCGCGSDGYELVDEARMIHSRLRVILPQAAEDAAERALARAARVAALERRIAGMSGVPEYQIENMRGRLQHRLDRDARYKR